MEGHPRTARGIVWLALASVTIVGCTGARRATTAAGARLPGDPGALAGAPHGLAARVTAESASATDRTEAATDRNVRVHPLEDIDHGEGHIAIDPNNPGVQLCRFTWGFSRKTILADISPHVS